MNTVVAWRRTRSRRFPSTRAWTTPLVLLLILALVVSCASPAPSAPAGSPVPAVATPSAGATGGPSAIPGPGESPAAWTALDLAPLPEVARLEPLTAGPAGVAVHTAFRLTSLDGREPAALAAALRAEPPLSFAVASTDGASAIVRPSAPLRAGTAYRISLARADGSIEASWAAVAAAPLHVSDTVPGDKSTGVPRNTGIEITFNQHGVDAAALERFFSISPKTPGAFRSAGRTVAFVPAKPLAAGRVYTVTVKRGLPLAGTGQVLAADAVFRFETRKGAQRTAVVSFRHPSIDGIPAEPTAVTVSVDVDEGGKAPASIPATIHRLAGIGDAMEAYRAILAAPGWQIADSRPAVKTSGLPRVYRDSLKLRSSANGVTWIRLPAQRAGWYLVTETFGGVPRQLVLQVTHVATFALAASDRTAVWVNDIRTGDAVVGATVAVEGRRLGVTDERGLLQAGTPATLIRAAEDETPQPTIVVVRAAGRSAFLAISGSRSCGSCFDRSTGDPDWWRLLATDREEYRTTDTINAWGMVRSRDTDEVPSSVVLELIADEDSETGSLPITTVTARPDPAGAFSAAVPVRGLPVGSYRIRLRAGSATLGDAWLRVATITKPAYRIALGTDRHAILGGETVSATATASFFEGTPVAGTELGFASSDEGSRVMATTDVAGSATASVRLSAPTDEQWQVVSVGAQPTLPEEAQISSSSPVAVFGATALVDAAVAVAGTRLSITGTVSDVAFERFENGSSSLWDIDPRGAARAGARVALAVVERTPVRKQVGTDYDFITKLTVPVYEYDEQATPVLSRTVTAGSDGSFRLALDVRGGQRSYDVRATYVDEGGRTTSAMAWADNQLGAWDDRWAHLDRVDDSAGNGYSVGDRIRVRLAGGVGHTDASRYLFAVTQRGLEYVTTGSNPTFRTTFQASWIPGVTITGVRFTGTTYEAAVSGYQANFRTTDRALRVELSADKARYAPAETARVAIRTLDAGGQPVPASVMVRVVDEKLYEIGAAADGSTLADLYVALEPGVRGWASSHRTPKDDEEWGKGDTTGGGGEGRSDFRDWLVAKMVRTGADGRGSLAVPLSDDLTSWRVAASGFTDDRAAGDAALLLPVGLPFFADAIIAAEYLVADRPVIRLRGFGAGLKATDSVTFRVSSTTLPMAAVTATARGSSIAEVPLPALTAGTHKVRIEGWVGAATGTPADTLTRSFSVVETRARQARTTWTALDRELALEVGSGLTSVLLVDAGRGRVVPVLRNLSQAAGARADQRLAAALAERILAEEFGIEADGTAGIAAREDALEPFIHEGGISILPYSSPQLEVSALAALSGDPRTGVSELGSYLASVAFNADEPRERRLVALAGLAGTGRAVLADIHEAAAAPDLSASEQVSLAIAALFAGDEPLAARLERVVLTTHGERLGGMVRIKAGSGDASALQTARLAIVAASLGDPLAADMDAWLTTSPSAVTSLDLERALAARGWARRVEPASASVALTVDGTRRVLDVPRDHPVSLPLTPAQAATARLAPESGSVLIVQTWDAGLDSSSLAPTAGQVLEREVSPSGPIGATDRVLVTLRVSLGSDARDECWRVTDLVPSGLAPMRGGTWYDEESGTWSWSSASPDVVDGQRVEFCAYRDPRRPVLTLRYHARVVTSGTYAWEPAVLQSELVPTQGLVLAPTTVTIGGAGG